MRSLGPGKEKSLSFRIFLLLFSISVLAHSSLFTLHCSLALAQTPQERLLQHYNRGVELANQGDFKGAEGEFKAALRVAPRHLPAHLSLGLVYEALGQPGDAILEYQSILKLNRASEEAQQANRRMGQIGNTPESARLIMIIPAQVRARLGIGDLEGARQAVEVLLTLAPENPEGLHFRGLLYVFTGQKEEAMAAFLKALEVEPLFVPSRYELGLLHEDAGRVEEAVREFQAIVSMAPGSPEASGAKRKLSQLGTTPETARTVREELSRGEAALKEGRLEEAQGSIEKVLQQLPDHVGALHGLGLIHLRKGQLVEGQRALARALEVDPAFARSRFLLGALYELQGRPEDAIKEYQAAQRVPDPVITREATRRTNTLVEVINERNFAEAFRGAEKPRLARARFSEGLSAMQTSEYEKAIQEFKAAIEIDPINPYFHFNLGLAYINQKLLVQAVLSFQKALELKPDHSLTLFWLALTYQLSGDSGVTAGDRAGAAEEYRKALDMLERSLKTNPEQWVIDEAISRTGTLNERLGKMQEVGGHMLLADALVRANNVKGALQELATAAQKLPNDPSVFMAIGSIQEEAGDIQVALLNFQKASEISPLNAAPQISMGFLLQKQGQIEQAEKAFKKAVEIAPNVADARNRLGGFYFDQKRFDEAKTQYEKAIEIDSRNGEAHLFLAQIYDQDQRTGAALKEYETALTLLGPGSTQAQFIEDRKKALRPISGSWSHTFFSYDNNANGSQTSPQESISNSFSLSFNYIALRSRRILGIIPLPVTLPVQFQTSNTSLLRQERFYNTESINLTLQTGFLQNFSLGTNYRFAFNYNDLQGPVSLDHEMNIQLGRSGKFPRQVVLAAGFGRLDSLVPFGRDRSSTIIFFSTSHNLDLGTYGSATPGYSFSNIQALEIDQLTRSHSFSLGYSRAPFGNANFGYSIAQNRVFTRLDQSGKNQNFSLGYSRALFGKLSISAGIDYTLSTFDVPRILTGQGATLVPAIETNKTYSLRGGVSYQLGSGLNFSMNYARQGNQSNLNVPRAGLDIQQQLLAEQLKDQFRSLGTYQKHLASFSLSKSF